MLRRIVLAANPSYAGPGEVTFWSQFDRACNRAGWRLVQHAARAILEGPRTIILPARLSQVANFLGPLPLAHSAELPAWFPQERFSTLIEWEYRRWGIVRHDPLIESGLRKLAWHVDGLYKTLLPAITIVSNKIDHGTALFEWAGRHYGSKLVFFERSPLDTFLAEATGMFAESEIWARYEQRNRHNDQMWQDVGRTAIKHIKANPEGFRPQDFPRAAAERLIAQAKRPVVFLPMDNVLWTGWAQENHWQRKVDYPGTPSPQEAIEKIADIVARFGGTLVIKLHPSDREPWHATRDNIQFVSAPLTTLLEASDICVSFLTKVAFVAMAMGIPTVTLAPNTVAAAGVNFHAVDPAQWESAIEAAINADGRMNARQMDQFANLLGWLECEFYVGAGKVPDFSKPSAIDLLERLSDEPVVQSAYGGPTLLDSTIEKLLARMSARTQWTIEDSNLLANGKSKLAVIFDVSRLGNTRLRHSGISRYAMEMLQGLRLRDDVDVLPLVAHPGILDRGEFKDNLAGFSEFLGVPVYTPKTIKQAVGALPSIYFTPYDVPIAIDALPNTPRVVTVHDVLHLTQSELYLDASAADHITAVVNSLTPNDHVITVSEYTRMQLARLADLTPECVQTVALAPSETFTPATDKQVRAFRSSHDLEDRPYFLIFAQSDPRKNLGVAIAGIRAFLDAPHDTGEKFVVIGSAVNADSIKERLASAHIPADRLVYWESPTDRELAAAYTGARALLYVSTAEGFGLPPLEAMACGCPVVTSSLTSIPEVVGDAGLYVDPRSVSQLANAITALSKNDSLRATLSERALRRSKQFSWSRTINETVDMFRMATADSVSELPESVKNILTPVNYQSIGATSLSDWEAVRSTLQETHRKFSTGETLEPTRLLIESRDEGVHAIDTKITMKGSRYIFNVMLRPVERIFGVIWIEPRKGLQKFDGLEIYLDLLHGKVIRSRVSSLVRSHDVTVRQLPDQWILVSIDYESMPDEADSLRFIVGARASAEGSSAYPGEGMAAIELIGAAISVPPDPALP